LIANNQGEQLDRLALHDQADFHQLVAPALVELAVARHGEKATLQRGEQPPAAAVSLRLVLENENDEFVVHADGRLADWLWPEAGDAWFVYQRGQQIYVTMAPRATRLQRIGLGADGGWGTYFTPRAEARYRLVVDVARANIKERPVSARLIAVAGGWK